MFHGKATPASVKEFLTPFAEEDVPILQSGIMILTVNYDARFLEHLSAIFQQGPPSKINIHLLLYT